ncbi:hypothetical protein MED134_01540 [Dokdonia sp. MED134]|uniref:DUF922 domain-containing protein n=1 Tax=Dokdonia sp. MED134 TaxID=313590 RepID=UPI000307A3DF|nr:hypothetical protein [Dokdonia sp. MED134]EAQ39261.2 hypothetical protein MED134_01540 [Dokdonia sp. MED134]
MLRLVYILCAVALMATADAPERFAWSETRALQWSDFKGSPGTLDGWAASSSTGMSQGYASNGQGFLDKNSITVTAHFYPEYSWVRHKEKTKHLLAHEQTHFDITEVYARKLQARIAAYNFTENGLEEIKAIYQEVEQERIATQKLFDKESNHSIDHMKELQWELRVARWLDGNFEE